MMKHYLKTLQIEDNRIAAVRFNWDLEARPFWETIDGLPSDLSVIWADRFAALESLSAEWALCLALEKAYGVAPPPRAQWGRALFCEVQRVLWSCHYFACLFRALEDGFREELFWALVDMLLTQQETVTGGRVLPQAFCVGGLRRDVSLGDLEKLRKLCGQVEERVMAALGDFEEDAFLMEWLTRGLNLGREMLERKGITGPLLQASGNEDDIRKTRPYGPYAELSFGAYRTEPDVLLQGRPLDRVRAVRFQMLQSLQLIQQIVQRIPGGAFALKGSADFGPLPDNQTWESVVEAPSGALTCTLRKNRIRFNSTSMRLASEVEFLLRGLAADDFEMSFYSLGLDFTQAGLSETSS